MNLASVLFGNNNIWLCNILYNLYLYNVRTIFVGKAESPTKKKWPSGHTESGIKSLDQVKVATSKKAPEKSAQRNILKGNCLFYNFAMQYSRMSNFLQPFMARYWQVFPMDASFE